MAKHRIGVLISGRGTNMLALINAVESGQIPDAEIVLVISDREGAPGIQLAKEHGIKTVVISRQGRSREAHEHEIIDWLQCGKVSLVCLAGFMRLLSPHFIEPFRGRILNIHPSLLPAFPGLAAQRQAIAGGVKVSGCTVHFVDETLDGGPIIEQRVVPILDDDTEETLAARILEEEHKAYVDALSLVVSGEYEVKGRRVIKKSGQLVQAG
jgi:phosphoribosylglycinamide formyltransferase-1